MALSRQRRETTPLLQGWRILREQAQLKNPKKSIHQKIQSHAGITRNRYSLIFNSREFPTIYEAVSIQKALIELLKRKTLFGLNDAEECDRTDVDDIFGNPLLFAGFLTGYLESKCRWDQMEGSELGPKALSDWFLKTQVTLTQMGKKLAEETEGRHG